MDASGSALVNFINTNDAVPILGDATTLSPILRIPALASIGAIVAGGFGLYDAAIDAHSNASAIVAIENIFNTMQSKPRDGHNVYIDSDVSNNDGSLYNSILGKFLSFDEHGSDLYVDELEKLLMFARDSDSPFSDDPLSQALVNNEVYSGANIHIAVASPLLIPHNNPVPITPTAVTPPHSIPSSTAIQTTTTSWVTIAAATTAPVGRETTAFIWRVTTSLPRGRNALSMAERARTSSSFPTSKTITLGPRTSLRHGCQPP